MVLGLRGKTFIASDFDGPPGARASVHFVAEGMLPGDVGHDGLLAAKVTATRGMREELGVDDDLVRVQSLEQTGVFFDTLRWQPCFAFLAHLGCTFDELATVAASAVDFWESDQLVSVPFDVHSPSAQALMMGTDPHFILASNHAQALAYLAFLNEFGFQELRASLRAPFGPVRRRRPRPASHIPSI